MSQKRLWLEWLWKKVLKIDGVLIEFYIKYWSIIKKDYLFMITTIVNNNFFLLHVTKRLISLLYEEKERRHLTNWYSIILLNVTYKIYVKALHSKLQSILIEIISFDQLAFFSMNFILNNIFLFYWIIEWILQLNQSMIFLKLDFSKAYNIVDWNF